ncbi:MAG: glycosyltransferase family 2 protein [Campylobacterota bacterium]|nr:glycosyltransferase family 2 protein [Campylobacterota bacterium]
MSNKLVSIAMCTYNGERFINEQLDSILNQTYKNLEIIITDDCSSDKTVEIIREYEKSDSRIKFHQNEKNLGFVKNFEKAISFCSGEYIALADQDDIWKLNKLEVFLDEIEDNVLIYSDAILIDADGNETGNQLIRPSGCLVRGKCNKAFFLRNCVSGNTLMFKKELVEHIMPIPSEMSYHDIWIAFVASTYGTITYTEEPMTYYRRYAEQVTSAPPVVYKNFPDKLKQKKAVRVDAGNVFVKDLNVFLTLKILKDEDTIKIIKLLIEHFRHHEHTYYHRELHKILKKYRDEVFAIMRPSKRKRRAFRTSVGLKLRTMTLFKL